jgi:hypothetical protein
MRRFDHIVLHVGPKTVLRPEQRCDIHVRIGHEQIDDVTERAIDGGGVADQSDPPAAKPPRLDEAGRSKFDRHNRDYARWPDCSVYGQGIRACVIVIVIADLCPDG